MVAPWLLVIPADLTEAIRVLGLAPERVTTIHCGIAPAYRPQTSEEVAVVRKRLDLPPLTLHTTG